jgi:hypothetical protein
MSQVPTTSGSRVHFGAEAIPFTLVAFIAATAPLGCGNALEGRSPVMLVIDSIAVPQGGVNVGVLKSDVVTIDSTTGQASAFEDLATVNMRLTLKDPGLPTIPTFPTQVNEVQIDRVRIDYVRTDGRNTRGVDVPYPIDGAMTFTVRQAGGSQWFTIVRAAAKLEPPLVAMANGGGPIVLSTVAEMTFFGRDLRGAAVNASGRMDVHFANWPDED